jgi:hypothetical protein
MKKLLLSLALACLGPVVATQAQVIWTQDFEGVVIPALPGGYAQNSPGATPGWVTHTGAITTWGTSTGTSGVPAHTQYVYVNENDNPPNLHDTLTSQVFSVSGYTNPFLNYDYFFYNATNNTSHMTETAYVIGSSDGGATWAIIDTLQGYGWAGAWVTGNTNLSPLTGANCKIGFVYSDGGTPVANPIVGLAVDNIQERNLTADSVHLNSLAYNSSLNGITTNGSSLTFTVTNNGVPASITAYYTINGGAPVSQTFPAAGTIAPFTSQTFTFTTAMAGLTSAGPNTIHVAISAVNGGAQTATDSTLNSTAVLASTSVQRQGLIEELSASTCNPCMAFNSSYDPLCGTLNADVVGSNFNVIKYQMNWPSPNNDRSYNDDGNTRRGYYGVTSIPEHFVNGVSSNVPWGYPFSATDNTNFTNEANGAAANNSFMDMTVSYTIDTYAKKLGVVLHVTPHFTKSGTYHVYTALLDEHYQNTTNTTGQLDYYHVMRKMVPTASGHSVSSWTDGTTQTFTDTAIAYTNGDWTAGVSSYPVQMDNKFWSNPLLGSQLVAFVEQDGIKSVMQSIVALPTATGSPISHVSVSTLSNVDEIVVYPNPTSNEAIVSFNLHEAGNVGVKVIDLSGRTVSDIINTDMKAGMQKVIVSTNNIPNGSYLVLISTAGGNNIQRLSVEK